MPERKNYSAKPETGVKSKEYANHMKNLWIDTNQSTLLSQVKNLADELLGKDYFSHVQLLAILQQPQLRLMACVINSQVIAFALAAIKEYQDVQKIYDHFGVMHHLDRSSPIGCLQSAGVSKAWRGKDIALQLGLARMQWLEANGCKTIYAVSWDHSGRTSKPVLEKLGFAASGYAENYFAKVSPDCSCPVCIPNRCTCGAHLMVRVSS